VNAALLAVLLAVTPTPSAADSRVAEGRWGGTGIALDVTPSGAKVELNCAHGPIEGALSLDDKGGFDLPGTLVRERPGPVRMDREEEPGLAVRYVGRLDGETLELRIIRPEAPGPPGPLAAKHGQTPRLLKCQ
jgi:hypothetical protein